MSLQPIHGRLWAAQEFILVNCSLQTLNCKERTVCESEINDDVSIVTVLGVRDHPVLPKVSHDCGNSRWLPHHDRWQAVHWFAVICALYVGTSSQKTLIQELNPGCEFLQWCGLCLHHLLVCLCGHQSCCSCCQCQQLLQNLMRWSHGNGNWTQWHAQELRSCPKSSMDNHDSIACLAVYHTHTLNIIVICLLTLGKVYCVESKLGMSNFERDLVWDLTGGGGDLNSSATHDPQK